MSGAIVALATENKLCFSGLQAFFTAETDPKWQHRKNVAINMDFPPYLELFCTIVIFP